MNFIPRQYQTTAVDSLYTWFNAGRGNPLLVLPTGAGKSWIQAMFIKRAVEGAPGVRILVVSHVKELLQQNGEKISALLPFADLGYCSAGLGKRDVNNQILVCGIQTAHRRAFLIGHADLIIVDESHLIPDKSETMYRTFFDNMREMNPRVKIIGMTATPYRLASGKMYGKDDSFFDGISYEVKIATLVKDGHLTRLVGRNGVTHVDLSALHVRGGEYIDSEVQKAFDIDEITNTITNEIIEAGRNSKGVLIFSSGVKHATHLAAAIRIKTGERVEVVSGKTNKAERETIIGDFKNQRYRWLINYGVLTTGFDAPHIDLIALCRATKSTGLYVQILGRGMRLAPGKDKCVILDYGNNIQRHGPIDRITPREPNQGSGDGDAPIKECPECLTLLYAGVRECPECGFAFPEAPPELEQTASSAAIMSADAIRTFPVTAIVYRHHQKKGKKPSMRVTYECGPIKNFSEWICFEHDGFARRKAEQWSERRGVPCPLTVDAALDCAWPGATEITVDESGKFPEIKHVKLDFNSKVKVAVEDECPF